MFSFLPWTAKSNKSLPGAFLTKQAVNQFIILTTLHMGDSKFRFILSINNSSDMTILKRADCIKKGLLFVLVNLNHLITMKAFRK